MLKIEGRRASVSKTRENGGAGMCGEIHAEEKVSHAKLAFVRVYHISDEGEDAYTWFDYAGEMRMRYVLCRSDSRMKLWMSSCYCFRSCFGYE